MEANAGDRSPGTGGRLEGCNLLVSFAWRAPGRAKREIRGRLRALGDPGPAIVPTLSRGILAVRTTLDPRHALRELRALCQASPEMFRQTTKWVPIDLWTTPDLETMRQAVSVLKDRIASHESWRMSVDRRAGSPLEPEDVIRALAPVVHATVNLVHPKKVLLIELFGDRVALAVLTPDDVLSVATVQAGRRQGHEATSESKDGEAVEKPGRPVPTDRT
jgi:tRNA(Ser,Leu) C12 N-acetylase TAN1